MFTSRNDKEALSSAMDEYIRDHAPVSCDDLVRAMEEQGFHCYPNMARKYLKDSGLRTRNVGGRWLWGMWDEESERETSRSPSIRTIKDSFIVESACSSSSNHEDEQEEAYDVDDDDDDERPVPESLKKAEAENARLQSENNQLMVAMLKTTQLKKSIKAMQEKLLVELADLIHATYGERESESAKQESDERRKKT